MVASLPSLGLLYLAAVTPGGHSLHYFEAEGDGAEPEDVYSCDLVAISTFSAQVKEAYAIAERLREAGVVVAMGGLHVSSLPEEAKKFADHVILGEGARTRTPASSSTPSAWRPASTSTAATTAESS